MANPIFKQRNISPTQSIAIRAERSALMKANKDALKAIRADRGMGERFDVKLAIKPGPSAEEKLAKRNSRG